MKNNKRKLIPLFLALILATAAISSYALPLSSSPESKGEGTAQGLKSNGIIECTEEGEDSTSVTSMITSQDLYYLADCIDNIKTSSGNYKDLSDALEAEIGERIKGDEKLSKDLQDCFTSVSNGKKKLVEALLTKSLGEIDLPCDSTFEEIRDGILALKTSYTLSDRDADIEYIYHTHKNTEGIEDESIENDATSEKEGGCFTLPRYNIHHCSDKCFDTVSKNIYHSHSKEAGCYTHTGTCTVTGNETRQAGSIYSCAKCGNTTNRLIMTGNYKHSGCNEGTVSYTYTRCGYCDDIISGSIKKNNQTHTYTYTNSVLSCTKSTTTPIGTTTGKEKICGIEDGARDISEGIECYELGCKMDKDNIIGAKIIFKD